MPIKQQLSSTRDHISFTPVSSNESPTSSDYESATSLDAASSDYKSATSLDGESSDAASSDYASSDYKSATSSDAAPLRIQSMPLPAPTQFDIFANCQPTPLLLKGSVHSENQNNDENVGQIEEANQGTAGPVLTPPRNVNFTPPKNVNYSNPNLSSSLESDGECRKHRFTDRDLVANHQPRPIEPLLKDFENQNNSRDNEQIEDDNQGIAGPVYSPLIMNDDEQIDEYDQGIAGPLLTPPETSSESIRQENDFFKCIIICISVCWDLVQWNHLFSDTFSASDILITLVSIGLFLFDVISDLILAATYYTKIEDNEIYRVYFGLTLSFVIIPSVITQLISYSILRGIDEKEFSKSKHLVIFVIHIFQLSVSYRYIRVIYYGLKSRYYECINKVEDRSKFEKKYELEVGLTIVNSLLESFMESAPQLVLQIYIVLMTKQFPLITVISCTLSLLSLSTTVVSTQRFSQVLDNKTQLSIPASIVIFCWKTCTILSRVVVFGLFLTVQPYVFLVCMILHWIVETVLLGKQNTGKWKSFKMLLFGITYGFVYIFCFINYRENKDKIVISSRLKMFVFYAVVAIENVVFSLWWYLTQLHNHTGLPFGNLSSTSSNETSTGLPFGILSSTTSNDTPTGLPFGNLSSTSSNETIVENELFPTESAGIIFGAVHGVFWLGMFSMLVYYKALHPKRSSPTCCCFRLKL